MCASRWTDCARERTADDGPPDGAALGRGREHLDAPQPVRRTPPDRRAADRGVAGGAGTRVVATLGPRRGPPAVVRREAGPRMGRLCGVGAVVDADRVLRRGG